MLIIRLLPVQLLPRKVNTTPAPFPVDPALMMANLASSMANYMPICVQHDRGLNRERGFGHPATGGSNSDESEPTRDRGYLSHSARKVDGAQSSSTNLLKRDRSYASSGGSGHTDPLPNESRARTGVDSVSRKSLRGNDSREQACASAFVLATQGQLSRQGAQINASGHRSRSSYALTGLIDRRLSDHSSRRSTSRPPDAGQMSPTRQTTGHRAYFAGHLVTGQSVHLKFVFSRFPVL
jgi:hypothetical protein